MLGVWIVQASKLVVAELLFDVAIEFRGKKVSGKD